MIFHECDVVLNERKFRKLVEDYVDHRINEDEYHQSRSDFFEGSCIALGINFDDHFTRGIVKNKIWKLEKEFLNGALDHKYKRYREDEE